MSGLKGFRAGLAASIAGAVLSIALGGAAPATAAPADLKAILGYSFETELVTAPKGDVVAWVEVVRGVRTIWVAKGPDFKPMALTHNPKDDGQELSGLTFTPDGQTLVWVRGGDHDENWPADGNLEPDPDNSTTQPQVEIWAAPIDGKAPPVKIAEGDEPTVSAKGQLAFLKDHQVWTAPLDGKGKPEKLFFDRGHDGELAWSPDGKALAFVSDRGDHGFIGIYTAKDQPLRYLAPTTDRVTSPRWSPDSAQVAFVSAPGEGGAPEPMLTEVPEPWAIHVASVATGAGRTLWRSPDTLNGSFPRVAGGVNLNWTANGRLVFTAELDGWEHLYSLPASGGAPTLLTPGAFIVEHVAKSADGKAIIYDANTGATKDDLERRHLYVVAADKGAPVPVTSGEGIETYPVGIAGGAVAFIAAGAKAPPQVMMAHLDGQDRKSLATGAAANYPVDSLVVPKAVTFTAADGLTIHGDLFESPGGGAKPAVIYVHGGPPRQMLLGWSYMDYYSNGYAVNQYLATHGFTVLSVNYRLGIGYGRAFQHPAHGGAKGASEYQDVVAGARFLQDLPGVDPTRIGMWGGSYGGYLTALALARDSDIFKAGVDFHGVHDWPDEMMKYMGGREKRYEKGDFDAAMKVAWAASPVADIAHWKSPVLLIQGDDDRNVLFHQTVDLARRLSAQGVPYEEMVIPNEIHGFLRYSNWLAADSATAAYLTKELGAGK
jgi:dipeptidyl aminopeptidase/acylaminoacyl peptidase